MGAVIFSEEMVKWLVLAGPHLFGDGFIPLRRVAELGVNVENYTPEWKHAVADDLPDLELCNLHGYGVVPVISVYTLVQNQWWPRRTAAPVSKQGFQPPVVCASTSHFQLL